MSYSIELSKIEAITRNLVLTNDQLEKVASLLLNEFNEGLGKQTHPSASVKMFPTYVRDVPNGRGKYGRFIFSIVHLTFCFFFSLLSTFHSSLSLSRSLTHNPTLLLPLYFSLFHASLLTLWQPLILTI